MTPTTPTCTGCGIHAHAWPEVYLGQYGWVPFEPTPTRGPPGAADFLGVAERQETANGAATTDELNDPNQDLGVDTGPDVETGDLSGLELGGGADGGTTGATHELVPR